MTIPLSTSLELNGRAGAVRSTVTLRATPGFTAISIGPDGSPVTPVMPDRIAHRASPLFGIGLGYHLTRATTATLDWERITRLGRADSTGEMKATGLNVGLRWDF